MGGVAVRALAALEEIDEIVVADRDGEAARAVAEAAGRAGVSGAAFDAASPDSVSEVVAGATVALNCVGPFYRFGPGVLAAVIEAGVPYVDVCDDLDATETMLGMHEAARTAGVSALIGMGNSPGLANVFVRMCADSLLDVVEAVDVMHVHGGEPGEGPAVVKHRIHAMTSDIPMFLDGAFTTVRMLEDSGAALARETDFPDVGTCPVYPYPHPETITLPRHIPGLRRATNLGVVLPLTYFDLTMDMVRVGMCTEEPLDVQGSEVVPLEVAVAHVIARRPGLLADAGMNSPQGCLKVEISGRKDGDVHTYVFSMSSTEAGAGEGTGIPAAMGAALMAAGKVGGPGVLPPEAAVDPGDLLALAGRVIPHFGLGAGGGPPPLRVVHTGPDGETEAIDLPL